MNKKKCFHYVLLWIALFPLVANAEDLGSEYDVSRVVVTGTRDVTDICHLPYNVTTVSREQLEDSYNPSVLPTLMEQTPGLFATSRSILGYGVSTNSAGSLKIRGVGSGAQLLVLIDGQPQYAGLYGHPLPDAYTTMMTEKVEVLRGPASLLYGSNAMAGVVNIVTRALPHDGSKTSLNVSSGSYGTATGEVSHQFRKNKFSGFAGAAYARTDGHRPNSAFDNLSGFLKLGYDVNDIWKVTGDLSLNQFSSENPGTATAPLIENKADITRGLASISLSNSYEKTAGVLRVFYDWGYHKINDGYTAGGTPPAALYHHYDYIGGLCWYQSASFFTGNRITAGIDWQMFGGEAYNRNKTTGARTNLIKDANGTVTDRAEEQEVAAYIEFRQDVAQWFSVEAGIRLDHHSVTGTEWVPQGGVAFHLSQAQDLKAFVSKGFRNPIIREMYMYPPANTDLEPERMVNYELAYSYRPEAGRQFGANLFYIDGSNLINPVYDATVNHPVNINTGDFTHYGFEVNGKYAFSQNLTVNGNYSFLHAKTRIAGAPESTLFVGANYRTGRFYSTLGVQRIDGLYLTTGATPETENYTLVNASLAYQLTSQSQLYVKGDNLLAECYQTYAGFYMPRAVFMAGYRMEF